MDNIEVHEKFIKGQLDELALIINTLRDKLREAEDRQQQFLGGLQILQALKSGMLPPQFEGSGLPPTNGKVPHLEQ